MMNKKWLLALVITPILLVVFIATASMQGPGIETLGDFLYFDQNLSQPDGQSCASCHDPNFGFVDPDSGLPVSEGVLPSRFGGRNSPSAAYAMFSPIRFFDPVEGLWIGGQFWDSRATGHELGDPLADQALGPFTNPVEMANHERWTVVRDVANSQYKDLYESVWPGIDLDNWSQFDADAINEAYEKVALSIAAFERTALFAPFDSKYDAYLESCIVDYRGDANDCAIGAGSKAKKAGAAIFSKEEWRGLQLFMGENNNDGVLGKKEGAMCAACHVADLVPEAGSFSVLWAPAGMVPGVFTDFTYDNLGVPKNVEYPLDPNAPVDLGLGAVVGDSAENGKFKVMTLRNIGVTEPYAHNGYFKTLKGIVQFYNTRDVKPVCPGPFSAAEAMAAACWPAPEYPATINGTELGNLGLSGADEDALVAFMLTLTDGYK